MFTLFARLRSAMAARAASPTPRVKRFEPAIESLEGRLVPSTTRAVSPPPAAPMLDAAALNHRLATYPAPPAFSGGRRRFEIDHVHFRHDSRGVLQTYIRPVASWVYLPTNIARYTIALYASWRQGDD